MRHNAAATGQPRSHAETLDDEDADGAGRTGIHSARCKTLFFESWRGQTDRQRTCRKCISPWVKPDTETTLIHTAVQNLERRCYFLRPVGADGWRFGHVRHSRRFTPTASRHSTQGNVKRNMGDLVKAVFKKDARVHLSYSRGLHRHC